MKEINSQKPMSSSADFTLSFCVAARNEEKSLPGLFECLLSQSYPLEKIQVLLVDGESDDATLEVMHRFAEDHSDIFSEIMVLNNEKRLGAPGWNLAIEKSTGDLVMIMGAHAYIPSDYIEAMINWISKGEDICGGKVVSIPGDDTNMAYVVNLAENSLFGGSIAPFRHTEKPGHVETASFVVYRKKIFDEVGQFDERLARTEDNEMHYRMKQAGYRFFCDPSVVATRETRSTFGALLKQKYMNGFWIGKTLGIAPRCFSLYHFIPLLFVLAIMLSCALLPFGIAAPALVLWVAYAIANVIMTITSIIGAQKRPLQILLLPFMFLSLHVGYGLGTIVGIAQIPSIKKSDPVRQ